MDISVYMDKVNGILKELCEYRIIRSYGVHFIEDISVIKVVFDYGKNQRYSFNIGMEYLLLDKDPLMIYHTIERYVLLAYEDLFSLIKEKHIVKEEHSE